MRCLLVTLAAATLRAQVSPVQKVIELLDGLKGKVAAELEHEEKLMEEYVKFCDSEQNEREDSITSGTRTVTDLAATIQEAAGAVQTLTAETEELAAKTKTADADLSAASKIRAKERADFEAVEKELSETVDTIERAIIVLKRGQTSFLQKKGNKEMKLLSQSLSTIIAATWVNSKQRQVVQSLLQDQDGDEDLSLQPQATTAAYESKGGSILDVLADMQEKASASLSDARKQEMEQKHAFEMLKQQLDTEIATMSKRMTQASQERTSKAETKAAAEGDKEETQQGVDSDTAYLKELKQSCAVKADEWAQRQKDASEEMAAIEKAKEILSDGVKVFLQQKSRDAPEDQRRSQVTALLRKISSAHPSFSLTQLVSSAASDPFGKVKSLIESMIERLLQEAGEEADAKAFCDKETSESKAKQQDLAAKVDQHAVRVEKSEAGKAKLASQIKALEEEIAALDTATAEATSLRQQEKEAFNEASAEYKQAIEAVANAMQVLQEYYSQGSFLQVSARQPEFGGAKTDVSSTILSMLEVAEQDFTKMLADLTAGEDAAVQAYDKLSQENKVAKAAKQKEVQGKTGEQKSLEMALLNYKEDYASTNKELDAVLAYLDKLKPQCETKVMTYAERKQKREEEIAGLKEALEILSA